MLPLLCAPPAGAHEIPEGVGAAPQLCDKYAPPPLSKKALERVRREGVRMRVRPRAADNGRVTLDVEGLAHVPAPVRLVIDVLSDYGSYTKFLPRVVKSDLRSRPEGPAWSVEVDAPFPVADVTSVTIPRETRCGEDRWLIRWRRVGGSLRENRGVTTVYPAPGGGTLIRQKAVVAADIELPTDYVGRGVRRYCHHLLAAFRDQAVRALENDWYDAWRRFRPDAKPQGPGRGGSAPGSPR